MDETRDEGTSMVGLPRESRISRAEMSLIDRIAAVLLGAYHLVVSQELP